MSASTSSGHNTENAYRRLAPKGDLSSCSKAWPKLQPLDDLVGAQQEGFGDRQPKRFGRSQVDNKLEFGGLLDRHVGRFRPAQNTID